MDNQPQYQPLPDSWREVRAEWRGETAFFGRNPSGGVVEIGSDQGKPALSPMELLLAGLAGCTGADVASIMEKKRQPLQRFEITVRGKRADNHPKVFKEIEVMYYLWGENLEPRSVEQAIQLSEEKYCSASAMLGSVARIRSSYRILSPGEEFRLEETG
ncbi:MAG TPA: OsmC family protein [Anaerolineales bacterium]|nr:OsmC family protein [Anaerolineales bacterium]